MKPAIGKIRELERVARQLEPDADTRRHITDRVVRYAAGFLDKIYDGLAFNADGNDGSGLYAAPISEEPLEIEAILDLVEKNVDTPALNPASGGHLAYIPGGGIYPAALGDYLADVTNRYAGVYYVGPGAVRMEHMLTRWMADLIGYPADSGGDLTSGGSIANLVGIVTARDAHELKAKDFAKAVVYMTDQAHHSVDKALRIAGLGECIVRHIDTDERFRMRADTVDSAIQKDKQNGLIPWLVVASAGTTDAGAVDPIDAVADVAERHDLWLHVDAAYGGFFLLCDPVRNMFEGIGRADSVVMDPHKGLFLPYGCGAVLIKDRSMLGRAHYYQANYMQDVAGAEDEYSPADHSPELTRHYRGLRLWLPLKLFGLRPFRACLEEKLYLARYFHAEIQKVDGFEAGPVPDLSVVTYRYIPKKGDADEFNRRIIEEVHKDGRVFLSSTMLDGKFTLRLAALAFRTHLDTIDTALDVLRRAVRRVEAA